MKRFALLALASLPFLHAASPSPESFSPTLKNLPVSPQLKPSEWDRRSYAVHEWGTFTSVSGSDGKLLSGLQTEEEALPLFVYDYGGRQRLGGKGMPPPYSCDYSGVTIKMETPVLYFYSPQALDVKLRVDFRGGLITQWFPYASGGSSPFVPMMEKDAHGEPEWKGRFEPIQFQDSTSNSITWNAHVHHPDDYVEPSTSQQAPLTATWVSPRATQSNLLSVPLEGIGGSKAEDIPMLHRSLTSSEKFLFYRGLGHFDIPLKTTADQTSVHLENTGKEDIPFALAWENNQIRWMGRLEAGAKLSFEQQAVLKDASLASLVNALIAAGLYRDEALAMLTTWRTSYFGSPGLRVFWIVPRAFTDRVLPLEIKPQPTHLQRVLVGRAEILTPAVETQLKLESSLPEAQQQLLRSRYRLPYLERLKQLRSDSLNSIR